MQDFNDLCTTPAKVQQLVDGYNQDTILDIVSEDLLRLSNSIFSEWKKNAQTILILAPIGKHPPKIVFFRNYS